MSTSIIYDIIIIGSGPSGYTAALYSCRANRNVLLFTGSYEKGLLIGGQLTTTTEIENFPGFDRIVGSELIDNMKNQAMKYGLNEKEKTIISLEIISNKEYKFKLIDENSVEYYSKAVIIATGSTAKRLNLPDENKYWNSGISACAVCDGALPRFRNKVVVVVGGGDSAMEEATFLSKFANKVIILVRSNKIRASSIMYNRVKNNEKITIIYNQEIKDLMGNSNDGLTGIMLKDNTVINCSGLFYAIGHTPNISFLKEKLDTKYTNNLFTEQGYIKTVPGTTLTNISGLFACGDVQDPTYRQAIVASGSGCMASLDTEHYLENLINDL